MANYKKNIQYSHYCGTELQNSIDLIWLAIDDINKGNYTEAKNSLTDLRSTIHNLKSKISDLDTINEMKY